MLDISPRRRIAGRALWIGAALALPLTASVSYAVAPPPPAAPAPPLAPVAPEAPVAPAPPAAPVGDGPRTFIWKSHHDGEKGGKEVTVIVRDLAPGEAVRRDENGNSVFRSVSFRHPQPMTQEQRRQFELAREQARKQSAEQRQQWTEQRKQWARQHKQWTDQDWDKWGAQFGEEWARKWQDNARQWQQQAQKWQQEWQKNGAFNFAVAGPAPHVRIDCDRAIATPPTPPVPPAPGALPGRPSIVICTRDAQNSAREALERAKASIASDPGLSADTRDEVIDSLDRELDRLDRDGDNDS